MARAVELARCGAFHWDDPRPLTILQREPHGTYIVQTVFAIKDARHDVFEEFASEEPARRAYARHILLYH